MPPVIVSILFYVLAALLIAMSLIVVTTSNMFHGAIAQTCSLAVSAGLFALLGADFLAVSQLLVYVGGVMIIMLFVVMLSQPRSVPRRGTNDQWIAGLAVAGVVCGYLVVLYRQYYWNVARVGTMQPTTVPIGRLLMNDFLVPFEAVSLVLLAALVGAVVFGQGNKQSGS